MKPLYKERSFEQVEARGCLFVGEYGSYYLLQTLCQQANFCRYYYDLRACDITSDETTRYPDLVPLVAYCREIDLVPTVLTTGMHFTAGPHSLIQELEAAGLEDWRVSLHGGSSASHDAVLGEAGSFERLVGGLHLVQRPVRFYTVLRDFNYQDLPTKVLAERPPTVWDVGLFNPFRAWSHNMSPEASAPFREMTPYLVEAIDTLERLGWEVNVRHWPLCLAEEHGFAENVAGFHQGSFDPWTWQLNVLGRVSIEQIEQEAGIREAERMRAMLVTMENRNEVCATCRYRVICDKPVKAYQERYGLEELRAVPGPVEYDPLLFQRRRTSQHARAR